MSCLWALRLTALLLTLAASLTAAADEAARDPTALPAALRAALAPPPAASAASTDEPAPPAIRQVMFSGGRAYVVQRGRRYAVGESLDGARIERITEQAVWLRKRGGPLRREPLYGDVHKRLPPAPAASSARPHKEKP